MALPVISLRKTQVLCCQSSAWLLDHLHDHPLNLTCTPLCPVPIIPGVCLYIFPSTWYSIYWPLRLLHYLPTYTPCHLFQWENLFESTFASSVLCSKSYLTTIQLFPGNWVFFFCPLLSHIIQNQSFPSLCFHSLLTYLDPSWQSVQNTPHSSSWCSSQENMSSFKYWQSRSLINTKLQLW